MAHNKALEVQEKKELVAKGEKTVPARYYMPNTDIPKPRTPCWSSWRFRGWTARTSTSKWRRIR